jgi:hypothetical protein
MGSAIEEYGGGGLGHDGPTTPDSESPKDRRSIMRKAIATLVGGALLVGGFLYYKDFIEGHRETVLADAAEYESDIVHRLQTGESQADAVEGLHFIIDPDEVYQQPRAIKPEQRILGLITLQGNQASLLPEQTENPDYLVTSGYFQSDDVEGWVAIRPAMAASGEEGSDNPTNPTRPDIIASHLRWTPQDNVTDNETETFELGINNETGEAIICSLGVPGASDQETASNQNRCEDGLPTEHKVTGANDDLIRLMQQYFQSNENDDDVALNLPNPSSE